MKFGVALLSLLFVGAVHAQTDKSPAGEAKWMLERLTGVKFTSDDPLIAEMAALIQQGRKLEAAEKATALNQFYAVTVKEMASAMSTRELTVREPLNDFSAAFIGVTRDQRDARELLYGNFYYSGPLTGAAPNRLQQDVILSNAHYSALEVSNANLRDVLVRTEGQQIATSATTAVANPDPAGVLTSRTWLAAHAVAGTNRRLVEYTFKQFLCIPMEGWADTSASDIRIGRDIDRMPGGDPQKFLTTCKGCHTGMDGFRGAFARWDYNPGTGAAIHTRSGATAGGFTTTADANGVVRKMNRPDFIQYAGGFVTVDDSFVNNANRGANALIFGWNASGSPMNGVQGFGRLVANSNRFTYCMAKRAWDQVCRHTPDATELDAIMVSLGMDFASKSYNMKKLFEAVAAHPKCRL